MLHCGNDLLTDLYKCFLKFKESFPKNGRAANSSANRDVQFFQELFDALINYIKRVVVTFENTSQAFYFYMEIFHSGTNFENPEQKRVD